jgi:dTDP-4-dehydrorhamnose 3,5-epimerase-like enzyme
MIAAMCVLQVSCVTEPQWLLTEGQHKQRIGGEVRKPYDRQFLLYLPKGMAHGYQTLTDDAEILYFVSAAYSPAHQQGVRWNDPAFGITWPLGAPTLIHDRDASYPDFSVAR